ncbi:MAG: hypothetical protein IPJ77_11700 [Planctomycetes bacterium]|nr:hypothetical protein [Planctomycetota bacterium]
MKTTWFSVAALACALTVGAAIAPFAPAPAQAAALVCVDDPPPDPADCPFCGGNPELHRVRIFALLRLTASIFERAVP